ncbi:MAG TPA: sigma 54-interacting transcriptional regulator [Candidatus Binataceae bacterium]|nr:sigma 54-interacting transcriptional regulator [Candidatus Binataceae bacterium]
MKSTRPENETERLDALRRYRILDTPPEPAFDQIAEMAANFFRVPMAGVSLVDGNRVWFKSRVGIPFEQTARDAGLCSSAMLSQGIYHLHDAAGDERALGHPFVGELGIRFYAAAPLRTHDGFNLGTVWVLDQKPRELAAGETEMLRALSALAMNQLELRLYAERIAELEATQRATSEQLRETNQRLARSEEQFRDLFEEAPIAYIHQGIDTRIYRANRTAMKILGVKPEEIEGMIGSTFWADSAEAQQRGRDALLLMATGTGEQGVVLELRRKDDGRPLWVRWWCKPDPDGIYTRSMFLDITEQVLLEQENKRLEERFRDYFEEAPIAYIVGSAAGIIRANRTAAQIFGVKPADMSGFDWRSLFADTPEIQRGLREALKLVESQADAHGEALELRRRDDGRSIWVKWWSTREAGKYARIMFLDMTDQVLMEREKARLEDQNAYLLDEIRAEQNFGDIIGGSFGLRKVMQQVELVAPTDATVLITGESGTGKELVARAIHERSARRERPLIKLNCSAVPEGLFESEFFGHVKGAFTGALKDRPGRFELADGGTLFLDEIGEVPFAMQAKLLRVLQEQELERVGDIRTRKVNVRVIAASNRDLKKEVDEGRFRQDLFYRLSVFPIEVPPLRKRREDIAPLVAHFIKQSARRLNRREPNITRTTLEQLATHQWPGNVRELQNAVERAMILWREGPLAFEQSSAPRDENIGTQEAVGAGLLSREELKHHQRETIIKALRRTNGKVSGPGGAAELLAMKPSTLASRISSLNINRRTLR